MITQKLIFDAMKNKLNKLIVFSLLMFCVSCNDPETTVTNILHTDGSVTRIIEMKSMEGDSLKRFRISDIQVPIDNTWKIKDSVASDKKGDKTWFRRAEKLFKSVDEINLAYKADSGINKVSVRSAGFNKKFRWFNTEYHFFERIEKNFSYGRPVREFLNSEELHYFYSPESLKQEKEAGPDSIKYKVLSDSLKHKTDLWTYKSIVSEWIGEFSKLTAGLPGNEMTPAYLKSRENDITDIFKANQNKLDSLWLNGVLLSKFIGEANALKYRVQADTAASIVSKKFTIDFRDYSLKIMMPGKLIGTNGFIDSSKVLLWPVVSDYFFTEPYEMWAESKTPNTWAWIVSGLFLAFVLTGVTLRIIKKG
jgi:hypothetical protein